MVLVLCVLGAQRTCEFCLVIFMKTFWQRLLLRLTVLLLSVSLYFIWNKAPVELNFGTQAFLCRLWWKIQFSSFPLSIVSFYFLSVLSFPFYLMEEKNSIVNFVKQHSNVGQIRQLLVRLISHLLESTEDGVMLQWPSFHLPK